MTPKMAVKGQLKGQMEKMTTKTPANVMFTGVLYLAEKPGFEPGRPLTEPTPLAGEPLRPLGYFSVSRLAEREGFEPPVPFGITGFQDQRLQPLGHRSKLTSPIILS